MKESCHDEFTSGTLRQARAAALMTKSLTLNLAPSLPSMALNSPRNWSTESIVTSTFQICQKSSISFNWNIVIKQDKRNYRQVVVRDGLFGLEQSLGDHSANVGHWKISEFLLLASWNSLNGLGSLDSLWWWRCGRCRSANMLQVFGRDGSFESRSARHRSQRDALLRGQLASQRRCKDSVRRIRRRDSWRYK